MLFMFLELQSLTVSPLKRKKSGLDFKWGCGGETGQFFRARAKLELLNLSLSQAQALNFLSSTLVKPTFKANIGSNQNVLFVSIPQFETQPVLDLELIFPHI